MMEFWLNRSSDGAYVLHILSYDGQKKELYFSTVEEVSMYMQNIE